MYVGHCNAWKTLLESGYCNSDSICKQNNEGKSSQHTILPKAFSLCYFTGACKKVLHIIAFPCYSHPQFDHSLFSMNPPLDRAGSEVQITSLHKIGKWVYDHPHKEKEHPRYPFRWCDKTTKTLWPVLKKLPNDLLLISIQRFKR